jgi:hypothetical protein
MVSKSGGVFGVHMSPGGTVGIYIGVISVSPHPGDVLIGRGKVYKVHCQGHPGPEWVAGVNQCRFGTSRTLTIIVTGASLQLQQLVRCVAEGPGVAKADKSA